MRPWLIIQGDVRQVARTIDPESFDALLCDPPYGLRFMGMRWDYDVPSVNTWASLLRALRPGAHAIIFGGSRTFHRLCVAVEDGGFEIRDVLMWLYGQGMPKFHDLAKAIDKSQGHWRARVGKVVGGSPAMSGPHYESTPKGEPATAEGLRWQAQHMNLKPAYEPAILARKMPVGTNAQNALVHGVGGLAVDACRVGDEERVNPSASGSGMFGTVAGDEKNGRPPVGRWPTNVVMDEEAAAILDAEVGNRPGMKGGGKHRAGYEGGMFGGIDAEHLARGDDGGPSRWFYTPKANRRERDAGCEDMPVSARRGASKTGTLR